MGRAAAGNHGGLEAHLIDTRSAHEAPSAVERRAPKLQTRRGVEMRHRGPILKKLPNQRMVGSALGQVM
jgi:hypothetical protein